MSRLGHHHTTMAVDAAAFRLDVPWADQALCGPHNADLFFIDGRGDSKPTKANRQALALCYECPVREACYDHARAHPEPHSRIAGGVMWRARDPWRKGRETR